VLKEKVGILKLEGTNGNEVTKDRESSPIDLVARKDCPKISKMDPPSLPRVQPTILKGNSSQIALSTLPIIRLANLFAPLLLLVAVIRLLGDIVD
jgi:hypothetical protein